MNQQLFSVIIFDLDGTLINTAPDVRMAINHMLSHYGLPSIASNDIYQLIGLGADVTIRKAFEKVLPHSQNELFLQLEQAKEIYLNYYRQHPVVESYIYPDVQTVLAQFRDAGLRLAICTNKPSMMTHLVLQHFQLHTYFEVIVAGDDSLHPKPHGQHILDVLQKMNCDIRDAIMVGDSEIDRKSSEHAGVPFIGVTYGYNQPALVAPNLIHHFSELPAIKRQLEGRVDAS